MDFFYATQGANSLKELMDFRFEIGYVLLVKAISLLTNNPNYMFVIISFITLFGICVFVYKYSSIKWMSILLFISLGFYYTSFNMIRQFIAIAIVMLSYKYLIEKNFLKFFMIVLCASLFHMSALIFIPFYFISRCNFNIIKTFSCTFNYIINLQ